MIHEQSFISGNDINDWKIGNESICYDVYEFMEENNLYYDPYVGKIIKYKKEED